MRYDTPIHFWSKGAGKYDPITHKHETNPVEIKMEYCNATDLGTSKQVQLLGSLTLGSKTVRLKDSPNFKYDYITFDDNPKRYHFISSLNVLKGYAMIVGEDND